MDYESIGKFIQKKRIECGLTQKELAEKVFVTGKAVSKWERGLSIPDVSILERLADVLKTDIYDILQIKKKSNIDVEKLIKEELDKNNKRIKRRIILGIIPFVILFIIVLFKLIPFGYSIVNVSYTHNVDKTISLAKPMFSFNYKYNEDSYSYKNLRYKYILKSELKNYINTLEHISCNDTVYYYDKESNITIVNYDVKGYFIYSTISYDVRNGNYCELLKLDEYTEKLGIMSGMSVIREKDWDIFFNPRVNPNDLSEYVATFYIEYKGKVLEHSDGTYEIIGNELIYTRKNIREKDKRIDIPNVSTFIIGEHKELTLKENYLSKYRESVIMGGRYE